MTIPPGTEVLLMTTRGLTVNQARVTAPLPAPLHPPDPSPKVKRASPGPTAQLKTSSQPPAPRNHLWDVLHHDPTLDPDRAPVPDPGLDASLGATDCLIPVNLRMFLLLLTTIT